MAGRKHQFILGLIIKKMREDGVAIQGIDGNYPGLFGAKVPLPPQVLRHRPDVIGVKEDGQICFGEAKTENDILNSRTYEQLKDFSTIELNGKHCDVFIGLPKSSEDIFKKSLQRIGLMGRSNIQVIYVPDEIING